MALRVLGADGLGEEPSKRHRVDLWISVMSVELDHLVVGGDTVLALKQVDELIRPLEHYQRLIERLTADNEERTDT